MRTPWVQFSWELVRLPEQPPPHEYKLKTASPCPGDQTEITTSIQQAYLQEYEWSVQLEPRV